MTTCKVECCDKPAHTRGYCVGHYARWWEGKPVDVVLGKSHKGIPVEERFWPRVNKTDTCWLWTGPLFEGYGRIKIGRKAWPAHRMAWVLEHGDIPDGALIDHKCRNRACVRVDHLQLADRVSNAQNRKVRSDSKSGVQGVSWVARTQRWHVRAVGNDGRRHSGGQFKTLAEAEAAAIALRLAVQTNNLQDRTVA